MYLWSDFSGRLPGRTALDNCFPFFPTCAEFPEVQTGFVALFTY